MIGINGNRHKLFVFLFALIDCILMLAGVLFGILIRFFGDRTYMIETNHLALRVLVILVVVQMSFYYFDLYDSRLFRERKKMGLLLLESLLVASIPLGVIYYFIPSLAIGRGIFVISLSLILCFCFGWRRLYSRWSRTKILKERVLIIGAGELAKKIKHEISENGYDGFEIVGFIDENRDRVGERI